MKINLNNLKAILTDTGTTTDDGYLRDIVYLYMTEIHSIDLDVIKDTIAYKLLVELEILEEE